MNWEDVILDFDELYSEYLLNILKPHGFALNGDGLLVTSSETMEYIS